MNTAQATRSLDTPKDTSTVDVSVKSWLSSIFPTLYIITLMAVMVYVSQTYLFHQSLRLDEAQSLWQTSRSIPRLLSIIAEDVHVPLYHVLLHFWQVLLGNDVATGRMFSLIFSVLTIPVVYAIGKRSFNKPTALFAATLMALSPFVNWFGSEIRMYSLLTFLAALNHLFYIKLFQEKTNSAWVGYGITAILGSFVHYFFLMILFSQALFYLTHRKLFDARAFVKFVTVAGILAAGIAVWLWYVYSLGSAGNTQPLLNQPTTTNLFNTFSQFLFGFQNDHINTIILSLWPLTVLLSFLILRKQTRFSAETSYFLLTAILPIFLAFAFSVLVKPLYLSRYMILTVPSLFLFLAWVFSRYPKPVARLVQTTVVVLMVATFANQVFSNDISVKENFQGASSYLSQNATPRDIIIVSAPFTVYPLEYYYTGQAAITTVPEWNRYVYGGIPAYSQDGMIKQLDGLQKTYERAWILLSYDQGYEDDFYNYLNSHYKLLEQKEFSNELNLYLYQLRYDVPLKAETTSTK
jgi:mannosyltransferase